LTLCLGGTWHGYDYGLWEESLVLYGGKLMIDKCKGAFTLSCEPL